MFYNWLSNIMFYNWLSNIINNGSNIMVVYRNSYPAWIKIWRSLKVSKTSNGHLGGTWNINIVDDFQSFCSGTRMWTLQTGISTAPGRRRNCVLLGWPGRSNNDNNWFHWNQVMIITSDLSWLSLIQNNKH